MTIQLPDNLENSIQAAVHGGRFSSVDEAITEAVRLLLGSLGQEKSSAIDEQMSTLTEFGSIGAMRDDADLLDQITQDIMEGRRTRSLRHTTDA